MNREAIESKVVLVGDTAVGKTCIVSRFTTGSFSPDHEPTLGSSFFAKVIEHDGVRVRLSIWDTAGQEKYRSMTPMYYRDADVSVIVYAIDSEDSFAQVDEWAESIRNSGPSDTEMILVANKIDLRNEGTIGEERGKKKADEIGAYFFEVSALSAEGLEELTAFICRKSIERNPSSKQNDITPENDGSSKCC